MLDTCQLIRCVVSQHETPPRADPFDFRRSFANFAKKFQAMHTREEKLEAFGRLLDVLDTLRVKCPWDAKQTNESLRPNTIEEVYELCDALASDDVPNIRKELGDVLLHVCFYSKIASEKEQFDIADVCNALCDKLIFRHPHIYGEVRADDAEAVRRNWEEIKLKEKGGNRTVLAGVPGALPALIKASRIQEKARNVGFDWEEPAHPHGKQVHNAHGKYIHKGIHPQ